MFPRSYMSECWWEMFKPIPTWPNCTVDRPFMWIGANNDQIQLYRWAIINNFRIPTSPNNIINQPLMWIGDNNDERLIHMAIFFNLCNVWTNLIQFHFLPTFHVMDDLKQCSNRSKNEISLLLINLLSKCLPHNDHVTDLEQCLNWVQLDLSPLFVNLSHELARTMTRYYCLGTEQNYFEQCLNWLRLHIILLLVKCSNKLAQA